MTKLNKGKMMIDIKVYDDEGYEENIDKEYQEFIIDQYLLDYYCEV